MTNVEGERRGEGGVDMRGDDEGGGREGGSASLPLKEFVGMHVWGIT